MNKASLKEFSERSLNSYEEEWCRLFGSNYFCLDSLRNLALMGQLRNSRFRSICWRLNLKILSENNEYWNIESQKSREIYTNLKNEYIVDPRQKAVGRDHPLSVNGESQWNKFFQSQDIIKIIKQDVVRTFPDIEFFHDIKVRNSMINILYCYSQISPLTYRQGMHEILAPLIFVLHCDHMAYEHSCELSILNESSKTTVAVLLDSRFIEHDAYVMFAGLMNVIEAWYDSALFDLNPTKIPRSHSLSQRPMVADPRPFSHQKDYIPYTSIDQRLAKIHNNLLKRLDLDLYLYLERLKIYPQMFGLRWLKLLFGREFTLQDLLFVWDTIFAIGGDNFSFVNHIYVSMLIHIRELLLANDFATCITILINYPTNIDVNHIIELALYLFDPESYEKPDDNSNHYHGCVPLSSLTSSRNNSHKKVPQRSKTIVGIETIANKFSSLLIKKPSFPALNISDLTQPNDSIVEQRQYKTSDVTIVYESSSEDSANRTPLFERGSQTLVVCGDHSDEQQKMLRVCVNMVDESIAAIRRRNLDHALATLKHTRDVLSGNLTLVNAAALSQSSEVTRSVSDVDIGRQSSKQLTHITNGVHSPPRDTSRLKPRRTSSFKAVELHNISPNNGHGLWEQISKETTGRLG